MKQTWLLSTTIMHTHTFVTGNEGHKVPPIWHLNGTGWEEVFLQLTFSGLERSWEPADGSLILLIESVRRGRRRDLKSDKDPPHEKYVLSYIQYILQVERTVYVDVASVPSSAKSRHTHHQGSGYFCHNTHDAFDEYWKKKFLIKSHLKVTYFMSIMMWSGAVFLYPLNT